MRAEGATTPMSLRHLDFLLQETFTGIRRNAFMSLAAVTTIAASLLVLGAVRLTTANLTHVADSLGDRFEMNVFLKTRLPSDERDRVGKQIAALPAVADCRLVPKEEALPELCQRLDGAVDLSDLGGVNPLPDAYVVRVRDLSRMGEVGETIRKMSGVDEVKDTRKAAETWVKVAHAIQAGGLVAVGLLIVAAAVIVGNTIRLTVYARRLEIGIMQLVGATHNTVRLPFLMEGAFHGIVGALLALVLLAAGYKYLHQELRQALPFLELLPPSGGVLWMQCGLLLGIGCFLGLAGSFLSVRKYLNR